jgi:hypothetical protein
MNAPVIAKDAFCAERVGVARLAKMSFDGVNLRPLWHELMEQTTDDASGAGVGLDLSIIAQLLGDKATGLAIQDEVLGYQRLYRSPCSAARPRLRLLALAAATDIGGNTPVEFLLEGSEIELVTLYVVPGTPLPPIPEHDVAMVVVCDSFETRATLAEIERLVAQWPRPLINLPRRLAALDRDRLYPLVKDVPGLAIPMTARVKRVELAALAQGRLALNDLLSDGVYPLVVRPVDSHAGFGLDKVDDHLALLAYLAQRPEENFFVSRFVDYSDEDGLFRKYRVVAVDGKTYACHMAIADQWKIWYLNTDMTTNPALRAEEAAFMTKFDDDFGRRHGAALREMFARVGLDYLTVDCAETRQGQLLVFEADSAAIVHNMDPPQIFPYKPPQMHKIFAAFQEMIVRCAQSRGA